MKKILYTIVCLISCVLITEVNHVFAEDKTRINTITNVKSQNLVVTLTRNVTPPGRKGHHPDVVTIGNTLYVAYRDSTDDEQIGPNSKYRGRFSLLTLDSELNRLTHLEDLYLDPEATRSQDIRVSSNGKDIFWYAFDSAIPLRDKRVKECKGNFLNVAFYDASQGTPRLLEGKSRIATGCATGVAIAGFDFSVDTINLDAPDDPAVLFYNDLYYILIRSFKGPIQHVRAYSLNPSLEVGYAQLDLSSIRKYMTGSSQSSLVKIDGTPYLITGIQRGAPICTRSEFKYACNGITDASSAIYAIPLTNDLSKIAKKPMALVQKKNEYNSGVVGRAYQDGVLYITYFDRWHNAALYLEAFDVKNNFISLARIKLSQGSRNGAQHTTLAIMENKLYAFSVGIDNLGEREIWGQQFEWRSDIPFEDTAFLPSITDTDSASSPKKGKCGDGICGAMERQTGFCPEDCEDEQQSDNGTGRCGDGICGAIEKQNGFCPQDCNN